jgi:hypothetical protein
MLYALLGCGMGRRVTNSDIMTSSAESGDASIARYNGNVRYRNDWISYCLTS